MSPQAGRLEPPYLFAFLRAVNLGQHNKVPMKPLIEALARQGPPPASYLLASGNLVFGSTGRATKTLRRRLEKLLSDEFNVKTPVILRNASDLRDIVAANPFEVQAGGSVHVTLWNTDEEVSDEVRRALAATDFGPDEIRLDDHAAYLRFAGSSGTSRLSNQLVERKLGVSATTRNLNTFERLLQRWPAVDEGG